MRRFARATGVSAASSQNARVNRWPLGFCICICIALRAWCCWIFIVLFFYRLFSFIALALHSSYLCTSKVNEPRKNKIHKRRNSIAKAIARSHSARLYRVAVAVLYVGWLVPDLFYFSLFFLFPSSSLLFFPSAPYLSAVCPSPVLVSWDWCLMPRPICFCRCSFKKNQNQNLDIKS